jgi:hypothetical protein
VQICVLSLGPGIFAAIIFGTSNFLCLHYSEQWFGESGNELPGIRPHDRPQQIAAAIGAVYLLVYLCFLFVHRFQVRKRHFLRHLCIKMFALPRQARDKRRENSQTDRCFAARARGEAAEV